MLTSPDGAEQEVAPEAIAEQVHQELARNEGTGVGELHERIVYELLFFLVYLIALPLNQGFLN